MWKLIATGLFICAIIFLGAAHQSEVRADAVVDEDENIPAEPVPEPITGTAVMPLPGSETVQKKPSEPYDVGPPDHVWKYEQLSTEEKAAVERGRAAGAARAGKDLGITIGVKEQSRRARAEAAQHQLGLDNLSAIGVAP